MSDAREFKNQHVDVLATVDPVKFLRDDHGGVPANVNLYWNRYETKTVGGGVRIKGTNIHPHGYNPASKALSSNVAPDLNPSGKATETDKFIYPEDGYPAGKDLPIDHFDIIGVVESDLIKVLTQ